MLFLKSISLLGIGTNIWFLNIMDLKELFPILSATKSHLSVLQRMSLKLCTESKLKEPRQTREKLYNKEYIQMAKSFRNKLSNIKWCREKTYLLYFLKSENIASYTLWSLKYLNKNEIALGLEMVSLWLAFISPGLKLRWKKDWEDILIKNILFCVSCWARCWKGGKKRWRRRREGKMGGEGGREEKREGERDILL